MRFSDGYTFDPSEPGTRETGLPPARPLPPHVGSINADQVDALMRHKAQVIRENTEALEAAYFEHEGVMRAFDLLLRRLERIADTDELQNALGDLRARRETMDRLLFTGGQELRRDEHEGRI